MDLGASAILAATKSGYTAKVISASAPPVPSWRCARASRPGGSSPSPGASTPYLTGEVDSTDRLFSMAVDVARREGAVACGDTVVITASLPIGISGKH